MDLTDKPIKKERKKRVPKVIHELDESLKIEFRKERIGSKVASEPISLTDEELYERVLAVINETLLKIDYKYIYVLDQLYLENSVRYLTGAPDALTIVVNNILIYNKLRYYTRYDLTDVKLFFYDNKKNLVQIK